MATGENDRKLDKTSVVISSPEEPMDEKSYWLAKLPAERMAAIETMRQIVDGYDPSTTRLQRVLITESPTFFPLQYLSKSKTQSATK